METATRRDLNPAMEHLNQVMGLQKVKANQVTNPLMVAKNDLINPDRATNLKVVPEAE